MNTTRTPELEAAYASCTAIARREAKNFYYGFLALPKHKRDAMCAVYAFMRRADDISDDESLSLPERRSIMAKWIAAWSAFRSGAQTAANPMLVSDPKDQPVFLAVRDVQQRFGVTDNLLDQLIAGTTMDLEAEPPPGVRRLTLEVGAVDLYETMAALERYCYLVASVVGLTTIRIFGYTDPIADTYAEQLGLAFQLTNILRDVKEDAERGRIYLPDELLAKHRLSPTDILKAAASGSVAPDLHALLAELAERAEGYYAAADRLIPLLQQDSQPAMRVLVSIYHLLLKEIVGRNYNVMGERVSVSTSRKLTVLAKGLLQSLVARGARA